MSYTTTTTIINRLFKVLVIRINNVLRSLYFVLQYLKSTYVMGKLTIVGFFSTKKLFLVNLLMQKTRYGGSLVNWNFFRKFSL